METAKALQEEGKAYFSQKKYKEALRSYAAALSHLKQDSDTEKEQAAALRANRSLCCLQLGDNELAVAEAEQAKVLSPAWPKAHFRVATALKACGRLGDARLATCEALRLAPKDGTIKALQKELQQELFAGCSALGEALDALEDFNRSPEETKRAAQVVKDMLLSDVKEDVLRAFMASAGSKTIFRRQNAMGDNWQEEARNGTMSLLSEITKAGPQLEEELVRLNQEAEALEGTCSTAGCDDPHAMSKAQDSKLDRQKVPPPPAPPEEEGFSGISKSRRKRKGQGLRKDEPAEAAEPAEPSQGIAVSLPAMSTKATDLLFSFGPLRALAVAAAVAQDWAKAASRFGENDADPSTVKIRQASWLRWAEILCRGVAVDLQIASPMMGKQLLKHLVTTPEKVEASKTVRCSMSTWSFILEIWRDDRRLWTTCLTGAHALPGFLEEAAEEPGQSLRLWSAFPTCYERMDVLLPGEARRSTLAGVVASLGGDRTGNLRAKALAVAGETTLALPVSLHAGSRFSKEVAPSTSEPLQLVLGLGARNVLPSPKAQCPVGSLELLCGLAFAGADGRWLDRATVSALLRAMS